MSAVDDPGDDTIFTHYLLRLTGQGGPMPMQADWLSSDRSWRVYIGRLGRSGDYGIVKINTPFNGQAPYEPKSAVFTWRWTSYRTWHWTS